MALSNTDPLQANQVHAMSVIQDIVNKQDKNTSFSSLTKNTHLYVIFHSESPTSILQV